MFVTSTSQGLGQWLSMQLWLVWNSLYRPGWPQIHKDSHLYLLSAKNKIMVHNVWPVTIISLSSFKGYCQADKRYSNRVCWLYNRKSLRTISVNPISNNVHHLKYALKGKPIRQIACMDMSQDYCKSTFLLLTVALTLSSPGGPGDTSALPCCKILHRKSTVHWWLPSDTTLMEIKKAKKTEGEKSTHFPKNVTCWESSFSLSLSENVGFCTWLCPPSTFKDLTDSKRKSNL